MTRSHDADGRPVHRTPTLFVGCLGECENWPLPNQRLKLSAPTARGSHLFVNDRTLRRSLGAIR